MLAKSSGYVANIAYMMLTHINTLDAVQGVRIDYALCSAGLVDKVVSCEIVSTPPKWSDHAAITLGEAGDSTRPKSTVVCANTTSDRQLIQLRIDELYRRLMYLISST